MKHTKKLILTLVLLTSVLLTACGAATDKVLEALERGNYAEADSIFYEKVAGDIEKEQRVLEGITTRLNAVVTEYNNGEKDYDTACKLVFAVAESELRDGLMAGGIATVYDLAQEAQYALSLLNVSKQAYNEGLELLKAKDYIAAIDCFENVIDADTNYRDAQEQLFNAQNLYESYILSTAQELIDKKDYSGANELYEEGLIFLEDNPQIISAMEKLENVWTEDVLQQAEEAFGNNKNYEEAIRILQQSGLMNDEVAEAIIEYESYAPISLAELGVKQKPGYVKVGTSSSEISKDVNEQDYEKKNVIYPSGGGLNGLRGKSEDDEYVTFYLSGEYTTLKGVLYRPYQTLYSDDSWWSESTVAKIYGDGRLLYEAPQITKNTYDTHPVDLDVTGVRELKIVMLGVWREDTAYIGSYNHYPRLCFGNMMVQK